MEIILGAAGWRNIGSINTSNWVILGNMNHLFAVKCEVAGNGDGVILADDSKYGLPYLVVDHYENTGERIIKATTSVSGVWYVKDLCV